MTSGRQFTGTGEGIGRDGSIEDLVLRRRRCRLARVPWQGERGHPSDTWHCLNTVAPFSMSCAKPTPVDVAINMAAAINFFINASPFIRWPILNPSACRSSSSGSTCRLFNKTEIRRERRNLLGRQLTCYMRHRMHCRLIISLAPLFKPPLQVRELQSA